MVPSLEMIDLCFVFESLCFMSLLLSVYNELNLVQHTSGKFSLFSSATCFVLEKCQHSFLFSNLERNVEKQVLERSIFSFLCQKSRIYGNSKKKKCTISLNK